MKIDIEEISPVVRRVSVEVPSETVDQMLTETYRQIGSQVRLKGFRKGRVPRRVLEQLPKYRNAVVDEVQKRLEQTGFEEVFENHLPDILAIADRQPGKIASGQAYSFVTDVEIRPSLDLSVVDDIEINYEVIEIQDQDVEDVLEQKRESKATLEPLDRGAQKGDTLKVQCTQLSSEDGGENEPRPFEFALGEGPFPEMVQDALEGVKSGEKKEIAVPDMEPGEESDEPVSTDRYLFEIEGVYERVLPALDDDFAKDEEHDDLAAMRKAIREEIEEREKNHSEHRAKEQMMDKVLKALDVPVPPQLLENHIDSKVGNLLRQLRMYAGSLNLDPNAFRENMREDATRDIQSEFLLQQVIKEHELKASNEDIDKELERIAESQNRTLAFVKSRYSKEEKEGLGRQIERDKARDFLYEKAKRNEETMTKAEREARIEEERKQEEEAHSHSHDHDHEHTHSHDHDHDHDCGHDHSHGHDHDHDHK